MTTAEHTGSQAPAGTIPAAAVALRLAGASLSEIARTLELPDAETARRAVEADLVARAAEADPAERDRLRALEGARIERLLRGVWQKATTAADPEHLPAARVALALIDRHVRLYGLDMPTEVIVHTPTTSEIDAWVAAMLAASGEDATKVPEMEVIKGEVISARSAG